MKNVQQIAVTVAKYWGDKLRGRAPSLEKDAAHGVSPSTVIADLMLSAKTRPTEETVQRFEAALAALVAGALADRGMVTLHVDYGPDVILSNAAEGLGIGSFVFPFKHVMWVHADGSISVREGYGANERSVPLAALEA